MSKLKKILAGASLTAASMLSSLAAHEKASNDSYSTDAPSQTSMTMTVQMEKTFNLPGGISIKKSDLDKIKKDNKELSNVDLLTTENDGFDGLKLKKGNKTHYVLMDGNTFQGNNIPALTFLTSEHDDLSQAHQMTDKDFKTVNEDVTQLIMKMGKKGLFNLDEVTTFLKDEAKKQGYSSMMLAFAGPETMMENALDAVFDARNLNTPDLSIAKKGKDFDNGKKLYAVVNFDR